MGEGISRLFLPEFEERPSSLQPVGAGGKREIFIQSTCLPAQKAFQGVDQCRKRKGLFQQRADSHGLGA